MSAEFDYFITVVATIKPAIDDARLQTIAERVALDLILDGLKDRLLQMLAAGENGRRRGKVTNVAPRRNHNSSIRSPSHPRRGRL
jgi:hypothetical protein